MIIDDLRMTPLGAPKKVFQHFRVTLYLINAQNRCPRYFNSLIWDFLLPPTPNRQLAIQTIDNERLMWTHPSYSLIKIIRMGP